MPVDERMCPVVHRAEPHEDRTLVEHCPRYGKGCPVIRHRAADRPAEVGHGDCLPVTTSAQRMLEIGPVGIGFQPPLKLLKPPCVPQGRQLRRPIFKEPCIPAPLPGQFGREFLRRIDLRHGCKGRARIGLSGRQQLVRQFRRADFLEQPAPRRHGTSTDVSKHVVAHSPVLSI